MIVVGVDPSNRHTGLACVRWRPLLRERLVAVRAVTMFAGDVQRSVVERIHPQIRDWLPAADDCSPAGAIWVEEAPPTALGDVEHGHQGAIGYAQGWLGGAITGPFMGRFPVRRVGPSSWRSHLLVEAAKAGLLLAEPRRGEEPCPSHPPRQSFKLERPGGGRIVRHWMPCNHEEGFANLQSLQLSTARRCPECERSVPRGTSSEAEAIRDAWKALACRIVGHFWPGPYHELVQAARGRARSNPPDHRLGGVADACEAVGIALHGLSEVA